ncbi:hypothetical protein TNCV_1004971 [Trichonephila clavipes]|nr:hypothetical protein TNCV_1004971 [Trichonephila clavipes]
MVLIKDDNLPVNKWSLGRITKLVPGTDGKVRVVEIKTNKGNIKHSIGKSVPTISNSEHSNTPEIPQCVKRNSRNRRKRPKVQKPETEIKMAPHRPRKSAPTEYATDEEDTITYDVKEEEHVSQILRINSPLKNVLQIFLKNIYAR